MGDTAEWQYSVGNHPDYHDPHSRYDVPPTNSLFSDKRYVPGADRRDFEQMAEHCAEDWFSNHDGWETKNWPQEFRIYENGVQVARVSVEMEARPHFSGYAFTQADEPSP